MMRSVIISKAYQFNYVALFIYKCVLKHIDTSIKREVMAVITATATSRWETSNVLLLQQQLRPFK